jgi:predicted RNA-binding Zn-ribbon protein involved in translation (DUF1610 family)
MFRRQPGRHPDFTAVLDALHYFRHSAIPRQARDATYLVCTFLVCTLLPRVKGRTTMSSDATRAPQGNPVSSASNPPKRCPHCKSDVIVWQAQMRRFDDFHDWYRCKQCGHEFNVTRVA